MKFLKALTFIGILIFCLTIILVFRQYLVYKTSQQISLSQKENLLTSSERQTFNTYPITIEELENFLADLENVSLGNDFRSIVCQITKNGNLLCFPLDQNFAFLVKGSFVGFLFDINQILEKENIKLNPEEVICLSYQPSSYFTTPLVKSSPENTLFFSQEKINTFCYELNPQEKYVFYLMGFTPYENEQIKITFYKLNKQEIELIKKDSNSYLTKVINEKEPIFERVSQ